MKRATEASAMRRKINQSLKLVFSTALIIWGLAQCEKGPEEFGYQIMHPEDSISAKYDTSFVLETRVMKTDSFSTLYYFFSQPDFITSYSSLLAGGYDDPHFGTLKTSFITQVNKSDSVDFTGDNREAVGADIYFKLEEHYGALSDASFHIYKINQDLVVTEPYYNTANATDFYSPQDKISESTQIMGDSLIKVTLTQAFADFLTTAEDTVMGDQNDFKKFFKGIYVEMEYPDQNGFISKINIANDTTRMELYHRASGSTENPDTLKYPIATSSIRFNLFSHNYQTATSPDNINTYLSNDEQENDSLLFVSGLGGTRAQIVIPEVVKEKFKQDSNFLARAEIQLKPVEQYTNDIYFPDEVSFYTYANDTSYVSISNNNFFNGTYDEDSKTYSCNITSYLQAYFNDEIGNTLYLHTNQYRFEPGLLVVSGTGHQSPVKLRIKYFKP